MTQDNALARPRISLFKKQWHKIALLGIIASIVCLLIGGLLANAITTTETGFIAGATVGIERIFAATCIAIAFFVGIFLKKWGFRLPFVTAFISGGFWFAFLGLILSVPSKLEIHLSGYELTTFERIANTEEFIFVGMGILGIVCLLAITFLIQFPRQYALALSALFACLAIAANVFALSYKSDSSVLTTLPRAKSVSWKALPSYLPTGVSDSSYSGGTCGDVKTSAASYDCEYTFSEYPGYLTQESQVILNEGALRSNLLPVDLAPSYFFYVTVIKDDPALSVYKFHNDSCDLTGLKEAGTGLRKRNGDIVSLPGVEAKKCIKVVTTSGKDLYYLSYLNHDEDLVAPVPHRFYFEHDSSIVMVSVGSAIPLKDSLESLYLTDAHFQKEFYKFVDSFN